MSDAHPTEKIVYSQADAKTAFDDKNYELAATIYRELWESSSKNNAFILSRLGQSLRKCEKGEEFIVECRAATVANKSLLENQYVIDTLCWSLYECHVKNYDENDIASFDRFIKSSTYIKDNSHQKNRNEHHHNPYVLTICKVVKVYARKASPNYWAIINWLKFLEPTKLSEESFPFVDDSGTERELASPKEFYYQHYCNSCGLSCSRIKRKNI